MLFRFKRENTKLRVAYIVSRFFEPFLWLTIIGLATIFSEYFDGYNRVSWGIILLAFLGVLPLLTLWLGLKKGKVKDIDFSKREERTAFILMILFYWFLGALLTWALAGPRLVSAILITAIIVAATVLIINLYWKVSVHALGITTSALFINQLFDWQYLWLFIFVPLVAWSRWAQKRHTIAQLLGGCGLAILAWVLLVSFGY
ncbi:hypothetical protein CO134_00125 [Candidatus Kuenenbacteria bacterium CG_4_9_14_3_um_filter_39_14]|uniref:Phosphatidic acid phosphatase type 2/haloperoxidase domain-containing protein n=5 Tax=Candidatus Kueneniibacteriota TaxID=1752740 RepID=A0A2M7MHH6_9BACT|nr:MAG: hypothetical protein COX28_01370 [Candidatus Kuenenbacteria bacterium CG23_combo_of_CG06-09_8_20_14_all_39_39]PIP76014.1 MAG: hypothetical protein COW86_00485 [Candidatus Kuenenbacteria bacterium CG22_combo_CG10-13_8_21_14_all_39_9]PIX92552.1 MAG: hypothetical protein COZ26_01175 [Candidatus Kuenenbacteria bacterium CG_4_10_14_3_um_filter_39_14]PJA92421.1 MAG: hypothetical protein CO134_00125 [Candidatus Kuenenbacteria bacterium CG_4_9_14_3_um_filter_39_14]